MSSDEEVEEIDEEEEEENEDDDEMSCEEIVNQPVSSSDPQMMIKEFMKNENIVESETSILTLTYKTGELLFKDSDTNLFFEVIGQMRQVGYSAVVERLQTSVMTSRKNDVLFNLPLFDEARQSRLKELDCFQFKPVVNEGGQTCKCGSTKTFRTRVQNRSGDEPLTEIHVCAVCSARWTV